MYKENKAGAVRSNSVEVAKERGVSLIFPLFARAFILSSPYPYHTHIHFILLFALTGSSHRPLIHMTAMREFKCVTKISLGIENIQGNILYILCAWFGLWHLPELGAGG